MNRDEIAELIFLLQAKGVLDKPSAMGMLEKRIGKTNILERTRWTILAKKKLEAINTEKKLVLTAFIKRNKLKKSDINVNVLKELKLDFNQIK